MPKVRVNGVSLHYELVGKGKETIVFSHGLLFDKTMFHKQVDFLKDRYRCICYDHRGQGQSQITKQGYDMDNLAQDGLGLMDALNIESCHFIGLSMGGFVGMRIAARYPNRINSLTLLDTSANSETHTSKYNLLTWAVRLFGVSSVVGKVMKILFGEKFLNDPTRADEKQKWHSFMSAHKKSIVKAVQGVINRQAIFDELPNIKAPTLVIVGDQDVATEPIHSQEIHKQIIHSQLVIIGGAGHSSTIEEPEQVNQAIEGFLKTL
ncbi:MAG: alpha/beta fold hydrolase [Chitinophagales bacterium]